MTSIKNFYREKEFTSIIKFGLLIALFSSFMSVFTVIVLYMVMVPNLSHSIVEKKIYHSYKLFFSLMEFQHFFTIIFVLGVTFSVLIFIIFLRRINPSITFKKIDILKVLLRIGIICIFIFILNQIPVFKKYNFINFLFDILGLIILFALIWFLFCEKSWENLEFNLIKRNWKELVHPIRFSLYGGVAGLLIGIIHIFKKYFFYPFAFEFYPEKSRLPALGDLMSVFSLTIFPYLFSGFLLGIIIYSFARPGYNNIKKTLTIYLVISISLVSCYLYLYFDASNKYDYRKDINLLLKIPKLSTKSSTLILLNSENPLIKQQDFNFSDISYIDFSTYKLNAEQKYINNALSYLKRNPDSIYMRVISNYIVGSYFLNFEVKSAIFLLFEFFEKTNSPLDIIFLLNFLRRAPAENDYIELLSKIFDEKKFYIGELSAKRIGDSYLHFGMKKEAEYWYKKSKERFDTKKFVFTNGKIIGEISINSKPANNIKITLISEYYEKSCPEEHLEEKTIPYFSIFRFMNYIATTKTDQSGYFEFNNITDDRKYLLLLMVNSKDILSDMNKLKVINSPGIIKIDKNNPVINLKEINVIVKK